MTVVTDEDEKDDKDGEDELVQSVLISRGQGGQMGNETMRQLPAVGELKSHPQTSTNPQTHQTYKAHQIHQFCHIQQDHEIC